MADTKQLKANFLDVPNALIDAIVASNEIRKENIAKSILSKSPKTVGIYRLIMKTGSDNFRSSAIEGVIAKLKEANVEIVIYEPVLDDDTFEGFSVIKDIEQFKTMSDVIVANRVEDSIKDLKVYTRDIFGSDK
jgi:UDPglucose 6-dehydrogenase